MSKKLHVLLSVVLLLVLAALFFFSFMQKQATLYAFLEPLKANL